MTDHKKKSDTVLRDKNTGKAIMPKFKSTGTMEQSIADSIKRNRKALDKLKKQ